MHRTGSENDQVCCLISSDFKNSMRRRVELPAELQHALRMTPSFGFTGN